MDAPTILIVEDEPLVGFFLLEVLEEKGWLTLGPYVDNRSAMECLSHRRPDLALVCLHLAKDDSSPTMDRLKELDVPFIIVSGYDYDPVIAATQGSAAWLTKPVRANHLVQTISVLLSGRNASHADGEEDMTVEDIAAALANKT